jgi:hypothetical protein
VVLVVKRKRGEGGDTVMRDENRWCGSGRMGRLDVLNCRTLNVDYRISNINFDSDFGKYE